MRYTQLVTGCVTGKSPADSLVCWDMARLQRNHAAEGETVYAAYKVLRVGQDLPALGLRPLPSTVGY